MMDLDPPPIPALHVPTPASPAVESLPPPLSPTAEPRSSKPVAIIQLCIVLLVGVIPDFIGSAAFLVAERPHHHSSPFWFGAVYIIARAILVSSVTLGMICWARERWAFFGFRAPRWRDILWTIAAILGSWILYYILAIFAWFCIAIITILTGERIPLESSYRFTPAHGQFDIIWLIAMSLCNGLAEELVMRAFLIPRFERLFGGGRAGSAFALLITAAIFASYHAYQGVYGVVGAFACGIVLGLIFLKTRSIWPIFLAHALMDIAGLLAVSTHQ